MTHVMHPHTKSGNSATWEPYHPTTHKVVAWVKTFCWEHETYHGNYGYETFVYKGPKHERFTLQQEGRSDEVA